MSAACWGALAMGGPQAALSRSLPPVPLTALLSPCLLYAFLASVRYTMDPRAYLKVKRAQGGLPQHSVVVSGVVCRKNVAHRRMAGAAGNTWLAGEKRPGSEKLPPFISLTAPPTAFPNGALSFHPLLLFVLQPRLPPPASCSSLAGSNIKGGDPLVRPASEALMPSWIR